MSLFTIDTLETADNFIASGFTKAQAKLLTETVKKAQEQNLEALATKGDLEIGLAEVKTEIVEVRGDLKLVKWMLAIVIAAQVLPLLKMLLIGW